MPHLLLAIRAGEHLAVSWPQRQMAPKAMPLSFALSLYVCLCVCVSYCYCSYKRIGSCICCLTSIRLLKLMQYLRLKSAQVAWISVAVAVSLAVYLFVSLAVAVYWAVSLAITIAVTVAISLALSDALAVTKPVSIAPPALHLCLLLFGSNCCFLLSHMWIQLASLLHINIAPQLHMELFIKLPIYLSQLLITILAGLCELVFLLFISDVTEGKAIRTFYLCQNTKYRLVEKKWKSRYSLQCSIT